MEKTCKYCGIEKNERDFFISRKTMKLEDFCKSCKIEFKKTEIARAIAKTKKRRDAILSAKANIQEHLDASE